MRDINLHTASPAKGLTVDPGLMTNHLTVVAVTHVTGTDNGDHQEILAGLSLIPLAEDDTATPLHITNMWHLTRTYLFVPSVRGTMTSQ